MHVNEANERARQEYRGIRRVLNIPGVSCRQVLLGVGLAFPFDLAKTEDRRGTYLSLSR